MTTFEPGASVVFTHGLRASRAAPIITDGLDVLVQEVIAAMTTPPWSSSKVVPSARVTGVSCWARPGPLARALDAGASEAGKLSTISSSSAPSALTYPGRVARKAALASLSDTRSCGRRGPAIDGTTVDRSSWRYSE